MGTRYVQVMVRTFMDPNDPADMQAGHAVQDQIKATHADPGRFEVPDWDQAQRQQLHDALLRLGPFVPDSRGMFGSAAEVDPVRHLLGTAGGWGENPPRDALYINVNPKERRPETAQPDGPGRASRWILVDHGLQPQGLLRSARERHLRQ
jgi:hypothetical protein